MTADNRNSVGDAASGSPRLRRFAKNSAVISADSPRVSSPVNKRAPASNPSAPRVFATSNPTTSLSAGLRADFVALQQHIAHRARVIFQKDLRDALEEVSLEWECECESFEAELARAEQHYDGICDAVEEINAIAESSASLASEDAPATQQQQAQLTAANAALHHHCTLYDGIVLGLSQSLARLTGPGGFSDRILAIALEAQKQFYQTALPLLPAGAGGGDRGRGAVALVGSPGAGGHNSSGAFMLASPNGSTAHPHNFSYLFSNHGGLASSLSLQPGGGATPGGAAAWLGSSSIAARAARLASLSAPVDSLTALMGRVATYAGTPPPGVARLRRAQLSNNSITTVDNDVGVLSVPVAMAALEGFNKPVAAPTIAVVNAADVANGAIVNANAVSTSSYKNSDVPPPPAELFFDVFDDETLFSPITALPTLPTVTKASSSGTALSGPGAPPPPPDGLFDDMFDTDPSGVPPPPLDFDLFGDDASPSASSANAGSSGNAAVAARRAAAEKKRKEELAALLQSLGISAMPEAGALFAHLLLPEGAGGDDGEISKSGSPRKGKKGAASLDQTKYRVMFASLKDIKLKIVHWASIPLGNIKNTLWQEVCADVTAAAVAAGLATPATALATLSKNNGKSKGKGKGKGGASNNDDEDGEDVFGVLSRTDIADLAALFPQAAARSLTNAANSTSGTGAAADAAVGTTAVEAGTITLLDGRRSQAINIALAKLRQPESGVIHAALSAAPGLTADQLGIMSNLVPTAEEVKLVRGFKGQRVTLASAESWVLAVAETDDAYKAIASSRYSSGNDKSKGATTNSTSISAFESAVQASVFQREFPAWVRSIDTSLDIVLKAQSTIKDSAHTRTLLATALTAGNTLNAMSEGKAGVYAVKLKDLSKLSAVKIDSAKRNNAISNKNDGANESTAESSGNAAATTDVAASAVVIVTNPETGAVSLDLTGPRIPLPPQANLAHFLTRILMRKHSDLCSMLAPSAAAFATAARIEQASLTSDISALGGQCNKFTTYVKGLRARQVAMAAILADAAKNSKTNSDKAESASVSPPAEWVAIATAETDALALVDSTLDYITARVTEVKSRLEKASKNGADLAVLLVEPDAKGAWELIFTLWGDFLAMFAGAFGDITAESARLASTWAREYANNQLKAKKTQRGAARAAAAAAAAGGDATAEDEHASGDRAKRTLFTTPAKGKGGRGNAKAANGGISGANVNAGDHAPALGVNAVASATPKKGKSRDSNVAGSTTKANIAAPVSSHSVTVSGKSNNNNNDKNEQQKQRQTPNGKNKGSSVTGPQAQSDSNSKNAHQANAQKKDEAARVVATADVSDFRAAALRKTNHNNSTSSTKNTSGDVSTANQRDAAKSSPPKRAGAVVAAAAKAESSAAADNKGQNNNKQRDSAAANVTAVGKGEGAAHKRWLHNAANNNNTDASSKPANDTTGAKSPQKLKNAASETPAKKAVLQDHSNDDNTTAAQPSSPVPKSASKQRSASSRVSALAATFSSIPAVYVGGFNAPATNTISNNSSSSTTAAVSHDQVAVTASGGNAVGTKAAAIASMFGGTVSHGNKTSNSTTNAAHSAAVAADGGNTKRAVAAPAFRPAAAVAGSNVSARAAMFGGNANAHSQTSAGANTKASPAKSPTSKRNNSSNPNTTVKSPVAKNQQATASNNNNNSDSNTGRVKSPVKLVSPAAAVVAALAAFPAQASSNSNANSTATASSNTSDTNNGDAARKRGTVSVIRRTTTVKTVTRRPSVTVTSGTDASAAAAAGAAIDAMTHAAAGVAGDSKPEKTRRIVIVNKTIRVRKDKSKTSHTTATLENNE